jgi:DNA-binding CsgD family transcriptional regulator
MIDARTQAALARLTDNEKECLRRRLQQQTAKEMALDLGVSPHAVEKRLKMARTKLGLSSSLEAARLLVASEEYQQTGPQASDLVGPANGNQDGRTRATLIGAIAMTILTVAVIVLAVTQGGAPSEDRANAESVQQVPTGAGAMPAGNVAASEAEIVTITQTTFHNVDADNSGFLEGTESPVRALEGPQPVYRRDEEGNVVPTGETIVQDNDKLRADFYRRNDKDGDGRISYPEFHRWQAPMIARNGIPAEWKANLQSWMSPEG